MTEPLVCIEGLTKRFNKTSKPALNNISLKTYKGKITGLVGPDGAGKTTLIRLINGLLHSEEGVITVAGFNSKTEAEKIHEITGYMPQKFGLYEDLSVIENLNLYAALRNISGAYRDEKYERLLTFTDLKRFQKRLAGDLSGGMKQKLGLACALIGDPQLLLLDEPSVGVDPISRRELWKMVTDLLKEGMGVIWSTAYLDEAEKCDTVILLNEGEKLHDNPPNDLLARVGKRTYHIQGIAENKRRHELMEILKQDGVVDGVIQGKNIRIVMKDTDALPSLPDGASLHPVTPCFEDAFVDVLGGAHGENSVLANNMQHKEESEKPAIVAENLTKTFGDFVAVKESSFVIKRGEIFGLLGPNGAGKSTTFKMMCGLVQPTSGAANVSGISLKTATSEARSKIGYMAQKFSLYGNLTVEQNLKFFSGLYGLVGEKQKEKIAMMVEIFDFKEHLEENSNELPLGFKQRLALACAVMHEPDVLFLDEPTSGVDPITRREFWTHINGMVEKGVTVMVTTHFMDEAEYCDRIGLIYRGENIAMGTPDKLKDLVSDKLKSPTLEDAFIELIKRRDEELKVAV